MNIVQIIPGSGGSFYCGNCLRDSKYFHALRVHGHQVTKIPMYLPLFSDEHDISEVPIFYGAISTYLKQVLPVFRKAPKWMENLLDSKAMLRIAASMASSTRANGLEDMTISMLLGEQGKQKDELEYMANWIAEHCKPDVIHLSNGLLLGLARRLKEKTGVPVICSLQDENVWVDAVHPSYREKIWQLMQVRAADVDALVSVSDYFALRMKEQMSLPGENVFTIHLGVDINDYVYTSPKEKEKNIGFVSRMCYENGFDIVVDAFIRLKINKSFKDVKLIATGGSTADDSKYIKEQIKKLKKNNLLDSFEIHPEFESVGLHSFFSRVSLISVPVRMGEAFGIYLLEAMASGVPVVQPALGAFPEIVELAGGGMIYEPNSPDQLCEAWSVLLNDQNKLERLSQAGYEGVKQNFNIQNLAGKIINLYKTILTNKIEPSMMVF